VVSKKSTSIRIDEELWKQFRIAALKLDKKASELLEELIRDFVSQQAGEGEN